MSRPCRASRAPAFWIALTALLLVSPGLAGGARAEQIPEGWRTPEPLLKPSPAPQAAAPVVLTPRAVTPQPIHTPIPVRLPSSPPPGPARATTVAGGNTYTVIVPVVSADALGKDLTVRLDGPGPDSHVELRLLSPHGGAEPVAAPVAMPVGPAFTPARRALAESSLLIVSESYPAGAVDLDPGPTPQLGLAAQADVAESFLVRGRVQVAAYTLRDAQVAGSTHDRLQLTTEAGAGYQLPAGPALLSAGVGYWARYVGVSNNMPPSLTTPFISSTSQLFHGPRLFGAAQTLLGQAWKLGLEAGYSPVLYAQGDDAVQALRGLSGAQARASASYRLGPNMVLEGAYQFLSIGASDMGFSHLEHGPTLALEGRF
jgi:hypothetical protein